jgi:hypothetical protein
MLYSDPYENSIVFNYEPGGNSLIAHIDVKSGYEENNLGYSVFRALVAVVSNTSTLQKWKMVATSVPEQDADRRFLRKALDRQSQILEGISDHVSGTYTVHGNWHLLPRRGYQRFEFWM